MAQTTDAYQWHGRTMIGADGEKIGKVSEIYEDASTGRPEWATVSTGLFGHRSNFVPLAGAVLDGDDIRARVTRDQVKDAPGVSDDDELSEREEQRLFEHYAVAQGAGATAQGSSQTGADHFDRSPAPAQDGGEDEARAAGRGSTETPTGRPRQPAGDDHPAGGRRRLRRYAVTEITTTIPVSEEETEISGGSTDSTGR
jgi:hypothetical protein